MVYRRTPKIQARMDSQRAAILDAAVELLATRGYAGCSVAAVADGAGVATGSVYRHFAGKGELVAELFRQLVTREVEAVERAAQRPGSAGERVVAVVDTFAARALKAPRLAYALLAEPVDAPVEAERIVFRRAFRDVIAERIAEGVRDGTLPPQQAQLTAAAVVGAVAEVMIGPLTSGGEDAVGELSTFTLRALGDRRCQQPTT
ncbi:MULTISPECIES: TetR/AcrR family transcriptional regulator [Prauserella salsuginis group]|uniref:AcrR family transcriptional regulator n=2 Tax=Prauserella salsuginis group TaxID=2893672 RepID=A0A839XJH0_9PSEU|nr:MULTISPECIES: TetR/AcrR family transcriptional regulator [Prauserella salsuginis group]MBB3662901.1 AcrR family transcriptional regulator [Prauserella sediminis]MCR3720602.1 transcriptional regulator, TetR family [Prauserella flava]MCR3733688.1 transcriptional regulator, TetR family [Prauserella salsuginis]